MLNILIYLLIFISNLSINVSLHQYNKYKRISSINMNNNDNKDHFKYINGNGAINSDSNNINFSKTIYPDTTTRKSNSYSVIPAKDYNDLPPVIVGIAGGSASGKTTLTKAIVKALGEEYVSYISHDSYYKDLSHLTIQERSKVNFDHPNALDSDLLCQHIKKLKKGQAINIPIYDYKTHSRTLDTMTIYPKRIIVIDGILIFAEKDLINEMNMKIYVDTEDDIRLIRRIKRDTIERQRTVDSIIDQYITTVRPMHDLYVEPSKRYADIIVPAGQGIQTVALEMCVSRMREIINFYQ